MHKTTSLCHSAHRQLGWDEWLYLPKIDSCLIPTAIATKSFPLKFPLIHYHDSLIHGAVLPILRTIRSLLVNNSTSGQSDGTALFPLVPYHSGLSGKHKVMRLFHDDFHLSDFHLTADVFKSAISSTAQMIFDVFSSCH